MGVERIIISEPIMERRYLASRLGASEVIAPSSSDSVEEINLLTGGRGADVVFECTGEEDAVRESCRLAKILGKVVVVGIPDGNDYPFDASTARRKELSAVFVRRSNCTTEKAIEWAAKKKADVACYATHHFPLEQAKEALEFAEARKDGVVRAIVVVNE
jgi:L-iditol 2-dehydrogenase